MYLVLMTNPPTDSDIYRLSVYATFIDVLVID